MNKIVVGDKVKRNDTFALWEEDVCPAGMDFEKVYCVKAIHNRTLPDMYSEIKFKTAELEGLEGEVNLGLIDKVEIKGG